MYPIQRSVYRSVTEVPSELTSLLDQDTFNKARTYQLDKSSFNIFHNLYKQLEFMVWLITTASSPQISLAPLLVDTGCGCSSSVLEYGLLGHWVPGSGSGV